MNASMNKKNKKNKNVLDKNILTFPSECIFGFS